MLTSGPNNNRGGLQSTYQFNLSCLPMKFCCLADGGGGGSEARMTLLCLRLAAEPLLSLCKRVSFGEWPWEHWSESVPPKAGLGVDSAYGYDSLC